MLNHRVFSLRIGLALAAVLMLLGVPALSGAATDAECQDAWADSSADDSCDAGHIAAAGDDNCSVTASCEIGNGSSRSDSITTALSNVDDLNNCGGFLRVGNCPPM